MSYTLAGHDSFTLIAFARAALMARGRCSVRESTANRLTRFLPEFMLVVVVSLLSGATAAFLASTTYLRCLGPAMQTACSVALVLGLMIFSGVGHSMLARGRVCSTGLQAGYFVLCLVVVTPTIQYRPHALGYVLGVAFPLLGILLLNTYRYQTMRLKLADIRCQ